MPETKIQSKQQTAKGKLAPKNEKTVFLAGKVMATVFWDSHGVILIDYLQKGKTITGTYYVSFLDKLNLWKNGHICRKRKSCFTKTTHRLIPQRLPRKKLMNYGLNCLTICLTHQIQPQVTSFCSLIYNHLCEQLFCRENSRIVFGWVTEMGASLGEVCRV